MQINISTRHGHLSDATRAKITAKVEKLGRLFERLSAIEVTVDLEHEESPSVDVKVSAEHKHDFVAKARHKDILAAVDMGLDKLEQQVRKYKEKIQDHRRTPARGDGSDAATPEATGE